MSRTGCDPTRLVELLEATTIRDCDETAVMHVSECEACRVKLEQFAADPAWWSDSRELLDGDPRDLTESSSQVMAVCDEPASRSGARHQPDRTINQDPTEARSSAADHRGRTITPAAAEVGLSPLANSNPIDFLNPPLHPELLGQLGKYQIEAVIGRGGMGIVLKGFDTELNRTVAIKVLAPHLASSGAARQRFSREARAAAAVVHDHVVAIHGIETKGDLPYIVMPLVGGESLQSYVARSGPLELKDIVRIAMQIAAGLSAAHEQGLVHRDIKPANILLENGFGRVLITDFGLARAADDASITRSGLVAGTPHYMSPEQASGESVDHRSDLFSLGSVLFFMATGRPPFRGDGALAVLNAICHKDPTPVTEINPSLPPQLGCLLEQLLKKDPQERMTTASDLRTLLADYLAHLQDPSRHPLPAAFEKGRRQRRRLITGSATAIACSLLLIGAFALWPETPDKEADKLRTIEPSPAAAQQAAMHRAFIEDFNTEAFELQARIVQTQRQWDRDTRALHHNDDPESALRRLSHQMFQLEREWSDPLSDYNPFFEAKLCTARSYCSSSSVPLRSMRKRVSRFSTYQTNPTRRRTSSPSSPPIGPIKATA